MDTAGTGCDAHMPCISVCKAAVCDTLPVYVEVLAILRVHFVLLNYDFYVTKLMLRTKVSCSMVMFVFSKLKIGKRL
jgi:hypothetical protein